MRIGQRIVGLCLGFALLAPAVGHAQATPAVRSLGLDEALVLARQHSRDIQAALARLNQARAGVALAWVALLPQVTGQGKYTHNYRRVAFQIDPTNPAAPEVVIQQQEQLDAILAASVPLLVPWAYYGLFAARHTSRSAEATFAANVTTVLLATAQAFYAAAGADELLVARHHAIEVAKQTLDTAKVRLASGVVTRIEVTRAEVALLRAEQNEAESLDLDAQTYRSLATIIGLHEPFHVVPPPESAVEWTPAPAGELAAQALRLRPEFTALEQARAAAAATATSWRWNWAPSINAFGNVRAFNYPGFSGDNYSWAIGLSLDWLIFDGGNRLAQRRLALAQVRENDARLSLLRDTVTDELYTDERALFTRRRALATARTAVVLSKETLDLVRVQYGAGTTSQLDVLQAQDSLILSELAVVQARFDLAVAQLQLERAAGTFPGPVPTQAAPGTAPTSRP